MALHHQTEIQQAPLYTGKAWLNFIRGIKSQASLLAYTNGVDYFMRHHSIKDPELLLQGLDNVLENQVIDFIVSEASKGKSSSLISQRVSALTLFYDMNRKKLDWKFIRRNIKPTKKKKDRGYTKDEIRKGLEIADARSKALKDLF